MSYGAIALLDNFVRGLRANDCDVVSNKSAGTVSVYDAADIVLRAIQKGHGQPWIASFYETDRIKWGKGEME